MKTIFIILLMMNPYFYGISAQDISKSNTGTDTVSSKNLFFAYGQMYNLKLDRTYSRLAKNGFNHFFNLGYENPNSNRIVSIEGGFMVGTLKTKGNNVNFIKDFAGNLKIRYLKRIKTIEIKNLSVYAGGNVNFRGDVWFPQDSELRYGWDINLGIGLATSIRYKINSNLSLRYDLDISLLGILWRSHNNGQQLVTEEIQLEKGMLASVFETPRFSHPFNTLYVDNSFKLFYSVSDKMDIYYNFILSYEYIKQPLLKKGYEFNNAIGITYKF